MCSGATQRVKDCFSASRLSWRRQVSYESQQDLASVHSLEDGSVVGNFLRDKQATWPSDDVSVVAEREFPRVAGGKKNKTHSRDVLS